MQNDFMLNDIADYFMAKGVFNDGPRPFTKS